MHMDAFICPMLRQITEVSSFMLFFKLINSIFIKFVWDFLLYITLEYSILIGQFFSHNASYMKFLSEIHSSSFDCHYDWRLLSKICFFFFWCVHGDFLQCQLSPFVFVWRSESHFSWQCVFVCLRAVRHMTLPIKPLSIQADWPIRCFHTAPIRQMAVDIVTYTHTLKDSDTSSNWMTMKKKKELFLESHCPFWSHTAPISINLHAIAWGKDWNVK